MFSLSGRVAVVTGGNGGIGLGMARGLSSAGAGATAIPVDVTNDASVALLVDDKPPHEVSLTAIPVDGGYSIAL
jgi:2-deoxy-D-gluconate 3-dehydrogenase